MPNDLYTTALRQALSQGDVLNDVRVFDPDNSPTGGPVAKDRLFRVMVLSHSCEVDKRDSNACLCARVRLITDVRGQFQDRIRNGRVANIMHLPAEGLLPEGYVEFRYTYRVRYDHINATGWVQDGVDTHRTIVGPERRLISLSDQGQTTLMGALSVFFGATR